MADPHIQSPMDVWDYITVILYRSGFVLATIMLGLFPFYTDTTQLGLLIAGTMLASSLHLYLKQFRYLFQFAMWIGLLCHIFGLTELAIGAVFLVLGGLSYKEYFCFRVFGLNFQPLLLAMLWFCWIFEWHLLTLILSGICGVLLLFLSIQKWKMPLHFDIGDKSKYQI